ncbi:MAG: HEAT repeat domain-containing protein [Planctomycetota bacterium]|nr:HEAT repeat domain-containing protein [Planctomycetota bacterium]
MRTNDPRPYLAALFLCLAGAPLAAALQPPTPIVQDDEVEDKREVVKELIKTFEGHTKKKGKEDTEAIAVMDTLLQEFEESGPKDRASIVKSFEKTFGLKRKENEDGSQEARVATAAAICLAKMAPESVPVLAKLSSGKAFKDNEALYRRVLISLGKTEHEDAVDPLLDLVDHKRPVIQGAAIEALANFREQDQKVRKEVVNKVLKVVLPIKSITDQDSEDIVARERYDIVGPPAITTLQNLTDENLRDFVEWQQWWNKNKNRDWDEED